MNVKQTKNENDLKLFQFPEKASIIAQRAIKQIENGEISPCTFAANVAKIEKIIKSVKESEIYTDAVLNSLIRRGDNGMLIIGNIKLEKIEAGIKYDYSDCGDLTLDGLYMAQSHLNEKIKVRETFLKGLSGKTIIIEEDTGEVLELYPPSRSSKTTYKATEIKTK